MHFSSLMPPVFSKCSVLGRTAQRQQGTASLYRHISSFQFTVWTVQRSRIPFNLKKHIPNCPGRSWGRTMWPAEALSWLMVAIIQTFYNTQYYTAGKLILQEVEICHNSTSRDCAVLERSRWQNCKCPFSEAQMRSPPLQNLHRWISFPAKPLTAILS